ncbi:MAG: 50S ribosomal protein L10 [Planctomycetota bacterium]|nr:MAG: 50S ribosomal protein L10 [Planctomycetota bacterium]
MSKQVKGWIIQDLQRRLQGTTEFLVVDSSRIDAVTTNQWRRALREKGIHVLVVKNSLARRALESNGVTGLNPILEGPSTLVYGGEDIVALSKEITRWAKELPELQIKGGTVDNQTLGPEDVEALSKSPGRLELIGHIVTLALSPASRLVGALLGPGGTVSGQLQSIAEGQSGND